MHRRWDLPVTSDDIETVFTFHASADYHGARIVGLQVTGELTRVVGSACPTSAE